MIDLCAPRHTISVAYCRAICSTCSHSPLVLTGPQQPAVNASVKLYHSASLRTRQSHRPSRLKQATLHGSNPTQQPNQKEAFRWHDFTPRPRGCLQRTAARRWQRPRPRSGRRIGRSRRAACMGEGREIARRAWRRLQYSSSTRGSDGAPIGPASSWECRAAWSRQARPERRRRRS